MRRAGFFAEVLAADIVPGVGCERNRRITALLRAVMHQSVFADVEITGAGTAAPVVGQPLRDVVLKSVDSGKALLFKRLHLVVDVALFVAERLQLATAVVDDSDGRAETQFNCAFADGERVLRLA